VVDIGPIVGTVGSSRGDSEILVLCYHAVSEDWSAPIAIPPAALQRQLEGFLRSGYRATTFTEAVTGSQQGKVLAVTFDDGYRSAFELGYPILSGLAIPGTVFVPTAHVGNEKPRSWPGVDRWLNGGWSGELAGASWDELRELAAAGWEIGSHARSHRRLPALDDASLAEELGGSRADCEDRLGVSCRSVAYAYGDVDDRVERAARRAGYSTGATISGPLGPPGTKPDPMRWPRLGIVRADGELRLRAKAGLYRHSHAWNLALRVRRRALVS
jgi:peptidoglycan/xylan/chitin deacetylase (PgdA/CDA1 family)